MDFWEEFLNYAGLVMGFMLFLTGVIALLFTLSRLDTIDMLLENAVLILVSGFAVVLGGIFLKNASEHFDF